MRRRESVRRLSLLALALLALLPTGSIAAEARLFVRLSRFDANTVEMARRGAMERLKASECRQVLADFKDAQGRTALQNLEPYAVEPDAYLAGIPFLDGQGQRLCQAGQSQLVTLGGPSPIFVCKLFLKAVNERRAMAEVYVIHEMLHTLGVPENPPSSQEITQQVQRRCAP